MKEKYFIAYNTEDETYWLAHAKNEDEARERLGHAVGSDGDEFTIKEAKLLDKDAQNLADFLET